MNVSNAEVVQVFGEIADRLEFAGESPFRVRAYRIAARTMREFACSVARPLEQGADLAAEPDIGPDLAGRAAEIIQTGTCTLLKRLRQEAPAEMSEMGGGKLDLEC